MPASSPIGSAIDQTGATAGFASIGRNANSLTGVPSSVSSIRHMASTPLSIPVIWPQCGMGTR